MRAAAPACNRFAAQPSKQLHHLPSHCISEIRSIINAEKKGTHSRVVPLQADSQSLLLLTPWPAPHPSCPCCLRLQIVTRKSPRLPHPALLPQGTTTCGTHSPHRPSRLPTERKGEYPLCWKSFVLQETCSFLGAAQRVAWQSPAVLARGRVAAQPCQHASQEGPQRSSGPRLAAASACLHQHGRQLHGCLVLCSRLVRCGQRWGSAVGRSEQLMRQLRCMAQRCCGCCGPVRLTACATHTE